MNGYGNDDAENKIPREPKKILSSEQEIKKHVSAETNKIKIDVLRESPEKKSIKKILVVDDEKLTCEMFKEGLEKFGYEVMVAFDGNEGLRIFRENPADLIITDIFMPEKDGHTFIHEIMQEFPGTKIFAITGKKSFEPEPDIDLNIAKILGAIKVFAKPIKISALLAAIKELS